MPQKTVEELSQIIELQQKQILELQNENALLKQELQKVVAELRKYKN